MQGACRDCGRAGNGTHVCDVRDVLVIAQARRIAELEQVLWSRDRDIEAKEWRIAELEALLDETRAVIDYGAAGHYAARKPECGCLACRIDAALSGRGKR